MQVDIFLPIAKISHHSNIEFSNTDNNTIIRNQPSWLDEEPTLLSFKWFSASRFRYWVRLFCFKECTIQRTGFFLLHNFMLTIYVTTVILISWSLATCFVISSRWQSMISEIPRYYESTQQLCRKVQCSNHSCLGPIS